MPSEQGHNSDTGRLIKATTLPVSAKRVHFCLYQLLGWFPYFMLQWVLFGADNLWNAYAATFAISVTCLAVTGSLGLRRGYQRLIKARMSNGAWVLLIVVFSLLMAMTVDLLHHGIWFGLSYIQPQWSPISDAQPIAAIGFLLFVTYVFWSCLYLLLTRQDMLADARYQQQTLEVQLKDAQIASLIEQLNPHFMFNAINNIRALILQDKNRARDMLLSFADIMRYQIKQTDKAVVRLQEELEFVREYLGLSRLHIGERMQVNEQIDKALLNRTIPRMALQLLVENAVKHGIALSPEYNEMQIIAQLLPETQAKGWELIVRNQGKLRNSPSDSGVGLKNLRHRLQHGFADNWYFVVCQKDQWVEACIRFDTGETSD